MQVIFIVQEIDVLMYYIKHHRPAMLEGELYPVYLSGGEHGRTFKMEEYSKWVGQYCLKNN